MQKKRKGILVFFSFFIFFLMGWCIMYCLRFQDVHFEPTTKTLVNPLMGWAPWATIEKSEQPHTLVYADLTWRDFEPQEGQFDFAAFEQRNQFARWRAEGKRVVFRFVLDIPDSGEHLDIPDWLFEKIEGDGDFYDHEYGKGFSPNYANPILIAYHQKAIQALGERYGQDDFIAYIELGSLGHWGEWHIKSDTNIRTLPDQSIRDQYVSHYLNAFPNTYLLMRRPFMIAQDHLIGFYNDMTADPESTETWLEWIQYGGEYSQTGEVQALAALPDQWQIAPIGGEQTSSMDPNQIYGEFLSATIDLLQRSHTTFISPNGAYNIKAGSELQPGIDRILATIGYRLYIPDARIPDRIMFGKTIPLRFTFANSGIAPFYYNWTITGYVFDMENILIDTFPIDVDLRTILPGNAITISAELPVDNLTNGTYQLGVAILDPHSNIPAVVFSMPNNRDDKIQLLGSFQVNRLFREEK